MAHYALEGQSKMYIIQSHINITGKGMWGEKVEEVLLEIEIFEKI